MRPRRQCRSSRGSAILRRCGSQRNPTAARRKTMTKLRTLTVVVGTLSFVARTLLAQNPANEHNCPSTQAIPPFVGTGSAPFSPNQSLCLPRLAPVPTPLSPLAFIVQGVEPGDRVDAQGTVYVVSIRGVPGGVDLWRWYSS